MSDSRFAHQCQDASLVARFAALTDVPQVSSIPSAAVSAADEESSAALEEAIDELIAEFDQGSK